MTKADRSICARRGCQREWHDEGPLCEEHFGDVELGRTLRGDYGTQEQVETLDAVADGFAEGAVAEVARLVRSAAREEGTRQNGAN